MVAQVPCRWLLAPTWCSWSNPHRVAAPHDPSGTLRLSEDTTGLLNVARGADDLAGVAGVRMLVDRAVSMLVTRPTDNSEWPRRDRPPNFGRARLLEASLRPMTTD